MKESAAALKVALVGTQQAAGCRLTEATAKLCLHADACADDRQGSGWSAVRFSNLPASDQ
jgi:hypothetical protein